DRSVHPGYWRRGPDPVAIPPGYTMQLVPFGETILLRTGERCAVIQASDQSYPPPDGSAWLAHFEGTGRGFTSLLLEGPRASRWPQGPTMCGGGVEAELVWLKLDRALALQSRDAVPIESCFDEVGLERYQTGSHTLVVETSPAKGGGMRITYDDRRPA